MAGIAPVQLLGIMQRVGRDGRSPKRTRTASRDRGGNRLLGRRRPRPSDHLCRGERAGTVRPGRAGDDGPWAETNGLGMGGLTHYVLELLTGRRPNLERQERRPLTCWHTPLPDTSVRIFSIASPKRPSCAANRIEAGRRTARRRRLGVACCSLERKDPLSKLQTAITITLTLLVLAPSAMAQQPEKYLLLATNRTGTMQDELNEAGARTATVSPVPRAARPPSAVAKAVVIMAFDPRRPPFPLHPARDEPDPERCRAR